MLDDKIAKSQSSFGTRLLGVGVVQKNIGMTGLVGITPASQVSASKFAYPVDQCVSVIVFELTLR
jgi:hypothetical protein